MILSSRFLANVCNVNDFDYGETVCEFTEGDAVTVYIQLIDAHKDDSKDGYQPAGRRFVPAAGATLSVVIENIDSAKKVTRAASQPFAGDPSIWSFPIYATDKIRGTATLRLVLAEGVKVTRGKVLAAFRVQSQDAL